MKFRKNTDEDWKKDQAYDGKQALDGLKAFDDPNVTPGADIELARAKAASQRLMDGRRLVKGKLLGDLVEVGEVVAHKSDVQAVTAELPVVPRELDENAIITEVVVADDDPTLATTRPH